ncbi:ribonuclease domain-containing protein [Nocardioides sp.]|uniref:ribonuclease domain-containing protein n=1 Tax=Nocardioides sp. TaxID=35761 RepID=UPI0035271683
MNQARLRTVLTVIAAVVVVLVVWRAPQLLQGSDDGGAAGSTTSQAAGQTGGAGTTDPDSGLPWVDASALPPEAADTLALIDSGGPFPYDQDGSVFYNNEQNLPDHDRGYYHEYTVETPGSSDRGARRIVAGAGGELYWTEDHYDSFERIRR